MAARTAKEEEEEDDDEKEERIMNDTTMPPPRQKSSVSKSSKVGTTTTTSSSSLQVARPKASRRRPGFGLADWNRLLQHSTDLAMRNGAPLRRNIRWKEIRQHNTLHDGWMVLKRKVYFISPYIPYHPGGQAILKKHVLGKDATSLYEKYHRWVNEDGLIGKLLIGYLDTTSSADSDDESDNDNDSSYLPNTATSATTNPLRDTDGFVIPQPRR